MSDIKSTMGSRLKVLRTEAKLSQRELGEKLGITGSSHNVISRYEKGESAPNVERLAELCEIFDVSADYFLGFTDFKS